MSEGVLLDNDVALKACAYRCQDNVVAATTRNGKPPAMLGIARFTLRSQLSRWGSIVDGDGAAGALEQFLAQIELVDPTGEEIAFAAELEEQAAAKSLQFDTGESQLVAILLFRSSSLLVTGDKRAVTALANIALSGVAGRLACLEQLFIALLKKYPHEVIREQVCAEPRADKSITNCFACSAASVSAEDILSGLTSYTEHLRNASGDMLIADADLLAVIP